MSLHRYFTREPMYTRLKEGNEFDSAPRSSLRRILTYTILAILSFLLGTQVQLPLTSHHPNEGLIFRSEADVFRYNRSFTEKPSHRTDAAWHSLFPKQGGYFRHPQIAPSRSAFAVFHQLHCLDAIRHGYWITLEAAQAGEQKKVADFPFHASPPHIRHCIDLIRQALMCQPDLTIETKDEEKGGVTGFGIEHQCIKWDSLLDWVGQWETYGQGG